SSFLAMILAVLSARRAGLDSIRSGFTSRFANRLPIFRASRLPRSPNGRSLSSNAGSSQLDFAWRIRNSVFMAEECSRPLNLSSFIQISPRNAAASQDIGLVRAASGGVQGVGHGGAACGPRREVIGLSLITLAARSDNAGPVLSIILGIRDFAEETRHGCRPDGRSSNDHAAALMRHARLLLLGRDRLTIGRLPAPGAGAVAALDH